jgi:DNA-binding response OmpR family regulator
VRILVVDPEPRQLETICRGLFVCGHEPSPARSIEDARRLLAAAGASGFELILADIQAPGSPGIELLEVARGASPSLPVLVLTGLTDARRLAELDGLGTSILVKPFTPSELDAAIREAAARPRDDQPP